MQTFATEEGAKGPQKGQKGPGGPKVPQPSAGGRRRGREHPNLLVSNNWYRPNASYIPNNYFTQKMGKCLIPVIHPITCIHHIPSVKGKKVNIQ